MKNKEFYHFFANGKRYDLLKDAKFICFKKETCYKNSASYRFIYHLHDYNFTDSRNSTFVSFLLKFDPLYYHEYGTRKKAGEITASEIMKLDDCPYAILSKMKSISNFFFPCEKKTISKCSLIKIMEDELNSYWSSTNNCEFYITYDELYNL